MLKEGGPPEAPVGIEGYMNTKRHATRGENELRRTLGRESIFMHCQEGILSIGNSQVEE
jgi:hypothetical protein